LGARSFFGRLAWISMQYGHCVVSATATAISSLYLRGITPPLNAASSKATKPLKASGASSPNFLNLVRFFMSYMVDLLVEKRFPSRPPVTSGAICTGRGGVYPATDLRAVYSRYTLVFRFAIFRLVQSRVCNATDGRRLNSALR